MPFFRGCVCFDFCCCCGGGGYSVVSVLHSGILVFLVMSKHMKGSKECCLFICPNK